MKNFLSLATMCAATVALGATDYPIRSADMTNVTITAGFWLPRFETNRVVTVKADFDKSEETGRLANFREAAKRAKGTFKGCPFDDSDVFKIIEGAAYTLATHPDPELEKYLDKLIADIAGAQEPDGYLYTARTLGMEKVKGFPRAGMMGPERWSNTGASHEFYNMGHMIEAGVAYWQVTGKRQLLDVAIKAADMMDRTFGYGPGQIQRVPGHEEIELALCKLYRATGEVRYLKLAKTLLDFRGNGRASNQNHLPVTQQDQACGHAVRAGYLYTAMADVAALLGDPSYRVASERLWKDVVDTKLHLNGGIGAHRHAVVPGFGSVGEAFGAPYDLPNESAYLETCAAIANALWNERLFLFSGDGKYMDVIERIIYNGFLSGISMSGDEFFYPNPLASAGGYARSKWFGCSCCPVNVVRFIPQIAQYAYAASGNTAYVNLFVASDAKLQLAGGTVTLSQETEYPWSGKVKIKVMPGETVSVRQQGNFTLNVRIPGWCVGRPVPSTLYEQTEPSSLSNFRVKVNGEPFAFTPTKGYCAIDRSWKNGDIVEVDMDMLVKRIKADARVEADRGRLAVERGPIVWCAEGIDNGGHARDIVLPADAAFTEKSVDVCGVKMPALATTGCHVQKGIAKVNVGPACPVTLVPYFAWCHRGAGEMQTWFPATPGVAAASTTQALNAKASYMHEGESTASLFDGIFPKNGAAYDNSQKRCTFWPHKGTEEWVEVILPGEEPVRGVDVYWFDDEPVGGCRVPAEWKVQTQLGEMTGWQDAAAGCPIVKGNWSSVTFAKPMPAVAVRLQIKLKPGFSAGICELRLR